MLESQKQLEKVLRKKNRRFKLQRKHNFKKIFLNITLAAAILAAGCVGFVKVNSYLTEQVNNDIVASAIDAVNQLETNDFEAAPSNPMLDEAKKINPDICGFITGDFIENENDTLPVLQGDSDSEYLSKKSDGSYSLEGSLGMLSQNDSQDIMNNKITIIQGHNLKNDQMFGALSNFQKPEYLKEHPAFNINDASGEYQVDVISAGYQDADPGYFVNFDNNENFLAYIDYLNGNAMAKSDIQVNEDDNVLILSTCTDDDNESKRFMVIGKVTKTKEYTPNLDNGKTR